MKQGKRMSLIIGLLLLGAPLISFGAQPGPAKTAGQAGSIWGANYFPDIPLVTQDGKNVRLFSDLLKGKVVAITFISTRDPGDSAFETSRMREVQRILGDRVGRDVFLYSITIDPKYDTPKVLKEYAEKFQAGPGWLFLNGKAEDITLLRKKLGLYRGEPGETLEDFETRLIVGNQSTGQWMKLSHYENPHILATKLGSWLTNWTESPKGPANYADAPQVREESLGEGLFRNGCATCHTIGGNDVSGTDLRKTGPDLFGVTRKRSRQWLTRWLAETDKVLAEKDPVAMELLVKYNNLKMPNMRLSSDDIEALIDYMDEETVRLENHYYHPNEQGVPAGPVRSEKKHH